MDKLLILLLLGATNRFPDDVLKAIPAQAPALSTVLLRLGSADPQERAWGAFYARAFRLRAAAPALLQLFDANLEQDLRDPREEANVVDALITLDAIPAPPQLERLAMTNTCAAVPMMLRRPVDNEATLVHWLKDRRTGADAWFALASALLEVRSLAAVREVYDAVRLDAEVRVVDPPSPGEGISGGVVGGVISCGLGGEVLPKGYPPTPSYSFSSDCSSSVCRAEVQLWWNHSVGREPGCVRVLGTQPGSRGEYALQLLRRLVSFELSESLEPSEALHHEVTWRQSEQLLMDIAHIEKRLENEFANVHADLLRQGFVVEKKAAPIQWTVVDARKNRKKPLPSVPRQTMP